MTSIGTIVWLASELMFFAALFAMFFTLASVRPDDYAAGQELLSVPFSFTNTFILVLSSVTCQLGVFAAERFQPSRVGAWYDVSRWGMREWYVVTFVMGSIFIAGQAYEYAVLISEGLTLQSSAFGSTFYITTGFHGLHVLGGLLAFLVVIGRTFAAKRFGHREETAAVVTSYYWHFVDVVWIALYVSVYFS